MFGTIFVSFSNMYNNIVGFLEVNGYTQYPPPCCCRRCVCVCVEFQLELEVSKKAKA